MSNTPRTEEVIDAGYVKDIGLDDLEHYMKSAGRLATHARQLERELAAANERAEKTLAWTAEDKPLPEDAEIHAHHPVVNGSHKTYEEALRMVGAKRSKGALVDLVNWLLQRAEAAERRAEANEKKLSALIAVAENACSTYSRKVANTNPHKGPLNYLIDAIDAARSGEGKT